MPIIICKKPALTGAGFFVFIDGVIRVASQYPSSTDHLHIYIMAP